MTATMSSRTLATLELPIVFAADEAARIAETTLYERWYERWSHQFALSVQHVKVNPGDVLTLTHNGATHTLRVLSVDHSDIHSLQVTAVPTAAFIYNAAAAGVQGLGFSGQSIEFSSPTILYLLDIPMLRDDDDDAGIYIAMVGSSPDNWHGAILYQSKDGISYDRLLPQFAQAAIGSSSDALASGPYTVWDTTNTVTIFMSNGTLSSSDRLSVINGANTALLGSEILSWQTATDNGDGSYTLSNLLRGRQGTEWAVGTHAIGDRFVVLANDGTVRRLHLSSNELSVARWYRAPSIGAPVDTGLVYPFTNTGVGLKPYAPCHIAGSRDGSNNLTITWVRRTRKGGIVRDFKDVPVSEESEAYEVDVMDGSTVLRTIEVTSETASYTAAQQTSDGLTPGDPVEVNIYQLSATMGRGYAGNATI